MGETKDATSDRNTEAPTGGALLSGEDLAHMPSLGRCELVRGRIVHASPTSRTHARVEARFAAELRGFVEPRGLGEVLAGEAGIYTGRHPDTVRGADVAFLSRERAARCSPDGFLDVAPDLVVEVLSPRDEPRELEAKIAEYLSVGVRLVWVADPARRTVRVRRCAKEGQEGPEGDEGQQGQEGPHPAPAAAPSGGVLSGDDPLSGAIVLAGEDLLSGEDVLPGFQVAVSRFFD